MAVDDGGVARKTRADKVAATRVKAATDAEANAGRDKCVSLGPSAFSVFKACQSYFGR